MIARFLRWLQGLFRRKPKTITKEYKWTPAPEPRERGFSATKAYADDRQKAPHNRHGKRWEHARDYQHRVAA